MEVGSWKMEKVFFCHLKTHDKMRFGIFSDFGGFLWWILIKFCKTKLEDEQKEKNWARNIFFSIVFGYVLVFFSIKFSNKFQYCI